MKHRYITGKSRPKGNWRAFDGTGYGGRVGITIAAGRKDVARDMIYGAVSAEKADLPYGLKILRHLDHKTDPNALHLSGFWTERRYIFFGKTVLQKRPLGYIPKHYSDMIAKLPPDMPLAAELSEAFIERGKIEIYILLLLPGLKSGYWKDKPHPFGK